MMAGTPSNADKPVVVPDLTGRVIFITGGKNPMTYHTFSPNRLLTCSQAPLVSAQN